MEVFDGLPVVAYIVCFVAVVVFFGGVGNLPCITKYFQRKAPLLHFAV